MIGIFLLRKGLIICHVIVDDRAQKFIELLVSSNVFKGDSFDWEAIIFYPFFVILKWFLCYLRVTQ